VGRRTNPWIAALALAARLAVWLTPARGADVARARALGIVSVSILAGHSKSAELLAYFAALACGIAAGAAVWRLLAGPVALARRPAPKPVGALEIALVAVGIYALFGRAWRLPQSSYGLWPRARRGGRDVAWIDVVRAWRRIAPLMAVGPVSLPLGAAPRLCSQRTAP
jgi:hypothetical protein